MNIPKIFGRRESGSSPELEPGAIETVDPLTKEMADISLSPKNFDGIVSLRREAWLEKYDPRIFRFLKDNMRSLQADDPNQIFAAIDRMRANGLDTSLIMGKKAKSRFNLFPKTYNTLLLNAIVMGKCDGSDLSQVGHIMGQKNLNMALKNSADKIQAQAAAKEVEQASLRRFAAEHPEELELDLENDGMISVETHADVPGHYGDVIGQELGQQAQSHRILYGGESDDETDKNLQQSSDRSGFIDADMLRQLLNDKEHPAVFLTGGNLRGCLISTLTSLLDYAGDRAMDLNIHIPRSTSVMTMLPTTIKTLPIKLLSRCRMPKFFSIGNLSARRL